jgi:hypothetical protein
MTKRATWPTDLGVDVFVFEALAMRFPSEVAPRPRVSARYFALPLLGICTSRYEFWSPVKEPLLRGGAYLLDGPRTILGVSRI